MPVQDEVVTSVIIVTSVRVLIKPPTAHLRQMKKGH